MAAIDPNSATGLLQRLTVVAEQNTQALQVLTNAAANKPVKPRLASPEKYDGSTLTLETYLVKLNLLFGEDPDHYTDIRKVNVGFFYCKTESSVGEWARAEMKKVNDNKPDAIKTWESFKTAITLRFDDPNKAGEARAELDRMRQGNMRTHDLFANYKRLMTIGKLELDACVLTHLQKIVHPCYVDRSYGLLPMLLTHDEWKKAVVQLDAQYWELQAVQVANHQRSTAHSAPTRTSTPNHQPPRPSSAPQPFSAPAYAPSMFAPRQQAAPTATPTASSVPRDPDAMDVDRLQTLQCYRCKGYGHLANICATPAPKTPKTHSLRALYDATLDEDKAEFIRSLGMSEDQGFVEDQE